MRWPVSIKAVVFDADGAVLLARNDREEWELPGGRLEFGESPEVAVHREVLEETGLEVTPDMLLRAWVFKPEPDMQILIVSYGCSVHSGQLRRSTEHSAVTFHQPAELNHLNLPEGYRIDIDRWTQMQFARPDGADGL